MPMANPVHPGEMLAEECLAPLGVSVESASKLLDFSQSSLQRVLDCNEAMSAELAVRIEKVFGISADFFLRMQSSYDLAAARRQQLNLKRYEPA